MRASGAWAVAKGTVNEFMEDNVLRLAAALAYYAMFSLGPLLVIVIAVAGFFMERQSVQHEVTQQLQSFLGAKSAQIVQTMFANQTHESSVIATVLGTIALVFGASGVFGQLQDALNTIWEVKPKPGQGIWGFIRTRFLSFAMVLGIAFLLLVSMVITTILTGLSGMVTQTTGVSGVVAHGVNFLVSFIVITLLFAMIFKVLPDAQVKWRDVWIGAIGTSLLFSIGKYVISYYLGQQSTSSSYGAAGSVVVILLWVYYSSLILFFGAEFTQVYARQTGSKIAPSPHAVPVTEEKRAEQGIPHSNAPGQAPAPAYAAAIQSPATTVAFHDGEMGARPWSWIALGAGFLGGWLAHRRVATTQRPGRSRTD